MSNIETYQPCSCGSGKKYKFCCKDKQKTLVRGSPVELVRRAAEFPIYECVINENWNEQGLATIHVVRQLPNSKYVFGLYLVDIFCLGLKNTFCNGNILYSVIADLKRRSDWPLTSIAYEDARSIVFGAIEYAGALGFGPNEDWADSKYILEPNRPFENRFEFGKDGEPFFIQGPDDDPQAILRKLQKVNPGQQPKFMIEAWK